MHPAKFRRPPRRLARLALHDRDLGRRAAGTGAAARHPRPGPGRPARDAPSPRPGARRRSPARPRSLRARRAPGRPMPRGAPRDARQGKTTRPPAGSGMRPPSSRPRAARLRSGPPRAGARCAAPDRARRDLFRAASGARQASPRARLRREPEAAARRPWGRPRTRPRSCLRALPGSASAPDEGATTRRPRVPRRTGPSRRDFRREPRPLAAIPPGSREPEGLPERRSPRDGRPNESERAIAEMSRGLERAARNRVPRLGLHGDPAGRIASKSSSRGTAGGGPHPPDHRPEGGGATRLRGSAASFPLRRGAAPGLAGSPAPSRRAPAPEGCAGLRTRNPGSARAPSRPAPPRAPERRGGPRRPSARVASTSLRKPRGPRRGFGRLPEKRRPLSPANRRRTTARSASGDGASAAAGARTDAGVRVSQNRAAPPSPSQAACSKSSSDSRKSARAEEGRGRRGLQEQRRSRGPWNSRGRKRATAARQRRAPHEELVSDGILRKSEVLYRKERLVLEGREFEPSLAAESDAEPLGGVVGTRRRHEIMSPSAFLLSRTCPRSALNAQRSTLNAQDQRLR